MEASTHILFAHQPTAFREVIASELPLLHPHLTVIAVDPAEFDAAMARMLPGSSSAG
jgi:hypothetical protein